VNPPYTPEDEAGLARSLGIDYVHIPVDWSNAAGQLCSFLATDLVLIVPFLRALPRVAPEFRTGLIVYTIVMVYSGLLAIYYLFIHRPTRMFGS